jgi:DNA processing protein
MESKKKEDYSNMNDDEIIIYKIIHKKNQIHIDGIIEMSKMTAQLVSTLLMQLELKGIIKQISGKYYKLEEI